METITNTSFSLKLFVLYMFCVYLDPLNMSNVGDLSWSWILKDFIQVQKEERKFVVVMFMFSIKRSIRRFHVVVVQWTSKKCTKKRDARATELLFCKPIVFWSRGCGRRRSCSSSLMLKINDILAALSLQTALSPGPFPTISEKLSDARTFNILRCDNLLFCCHAKYGLFAVLSSACCKYEFSFVEC